MAAKMMEAFGESKTLRDWSRDARCKVGLRTLRNRLSINGWEIERAIATPPTEPQACHAKLTAEQAMKILGRLRAGESARVLASEFGVTLQHVQEIGAGNKWRKVGA